MIAAHPEAKRAVPELRMIVVAGPRIDPDSLPFLDGLEVRPYVHNLYRHLAACDLAVAQGGLTTSMELTANRRPFIYFPLKHHFEQNFHVRHRLERYGAGRRMDFDDSAARRDRRGDRAGGRARGRLQAGRDRRRAQGRRAPRGDAELSRDGEQTRARYPDEEGFVERDGVRTFYERYGEGDTTVLLLPTWSIIHSRVWKGQVHYLARHFRLLTFDGRGNGRSDRPRTPEAYAEQEFADDALAVMNATETDRAMLVCLSRGIERAMLLAAGHPDRVAGIVAIAPALPLPPAAPRAGAEEAFRRPLPSYDGWDKWNSNYWLEHYEDFLEFFFSRVFSEPHSTKQREDAVGWALETDPETLIATQRAPRLPDEAAVRELAAQIRCPVLVLHGTDDDVRPHDSGSLLAEILSGTFVSLEGSGHSPQGRIPVKVNLLIRAFVESVRDGTAARPQHTAALSG